MEESLDVFDHLAQMLDVTAAVAWAKLGLRPDIMSGKIAQDLPQAKVAIDTVAYFSGILEDRLDGEDRRRVQSLVRDLRMNYVSRTREGT